MMKIITITGQSLDEFFKQRIPGVLIDKLIVKLRVLRLEGKNCIGAFVFPYGDRYVFRVEDVHSPDKANVYISFIDLQNLIIIIDAVLSNNV